MSTPWSEVCVRIKCTGFGALVETGLWGTKDDKLCVKDSQERRQGEWGIPDGDL